MKEEIVMVARVRRMGTGLLAIALVAGSAGCYHAVIETGRPASAEKIDKPWAHSFIAGLVPPDVIETAERCPNGVSRVETRHSFLNMVAAAVTWSIYSPMHITVTCASSAASSGDANEASPFNLDRALPRS